MQQIYVSASQLACRYGVDRSTIWRWTARKILPQPVKLSDQVTRWRLDEIEARDAALDQDSPTAAAG